jgi:DNA replication and repair protein RecF
MLVSRARLCNVRSRSSLEVEFGSGLTVLVGPNGAGKTTVLEALTLVLRGDLLRAAGVRDLINREGEYLRVELELEESGVRTVATAAYSRDGQRRLTADGAVLEDARRWQEALPLRSFVPDDLRLIKSGPRRRREYLDELAARCEPGYRATLDRYAEALAQRNMLLRMSRHGGHDAQFTPWETILAQAGLAVSAARATTLASFVGHFQRAYGDLTGEVAETLHLVYRSNIAGLEEGEYRERLAEMRDADRQRTFTHLGPHRDDLRLMRGGLDMRECASQGEQRAAVLTLVLAEWEQSCGQAARPSLSGGPKPLLLLDDVMSELDESRRRALVRMVKRGGQVIVTTTDLRYFSNGELEDSTVVDLGER